MFSERFWAKHSHPLSGWSRFATYPFVFLPFWYHSWILFFLVVIWLAVNPILFPEPKSLNNWISKGVLGEKIWTRKKPWGLPMLLVFLMIPLFLTSLITAYYNLFWPTMFFAGIAFVMKLWFVDRMVFLYEANLRQSQNQKSEP